VHESRKLQYDRAANGIALVFGDEFRYGINQGASKRELDRLGLVVLLLRGSQRASLAKNDELTLLCLSASIIFRPPATNIFNKNVCSSSSSAHGLSSFSNTD
jgi:hypothetical protein